MKIEIGKRYMFDVLGSQHVANDTYTVTVVKKNSLFSNKYICVSDQTGQTLIVHKKLLTPILPDNKNLPIFIQRKVNSLTFDEIDYNILDNIYSDSLETLREFIPKDDERINKLMDGLIDAIKMNLGIIMSKMSLQVYNNKEAINVELAENRLVRNYISPNGINKNSFSKDLERAVDKFIISTKKDILEADSYDIVDEIFQERFPYNYIMSIIEVNDNSIENLITMIINTLSKPNTDFVVIPTITPETNLSDITEDDLDRIKNFSNITDINEMDNSLDELSSFKFSFSTMIFDKEQSYDEMHDIINEVFEACTLEKDDRKTTVLPFDIVVLSYEYSNSGE